MSFEDSLRRGQEAERRILDLFMATGHFVVHMDYGKNGKGPRLEGGGIEMILPDLLVFHESGHSFWVECKDKTVWDLHRNTGDYVTGVDLKNFNDYLKVWVTTGRPVYLFFIHDNTVYYKDIGTLSREYHHKYDEGEDTPQKPHMIYWTKEQLNPWKS